MTKHSFTHNDRVEATEAVGDVVVGDQGTVVAAWVRSNITVKWDKDGALRRINYKRIKAI